MEKKISFCLSKGLLYWFAGGIIFFAVELIYNIKVGRLFNSPQEPIFILLIYFLSILLGGTFFGSLRYIQTRKLPAWNIDDEKFFWISFFMFWLFIYILLWVNDKNPFTFFAPVSIAANFVLLFIFIVPSMLIYKTCSVLKRKGIKNIFLFFCAFCITATTYIVFALETNWQRYRISVERAESFLTSKLIFFNLFLILGSILLFGVSLYSLFMVEKLLSKLKFNKYGLILMIVLIIVVAGSLSPWLLKPKTKTETIKSTNMPNIILIVLDAVRSSELSCYGYPKLTTPNIDKLSTEGFLFENFISNFTHTKTAIPTLLSSRYVTLSLLEDKKSMKNLNFLQEYLARMQYFTLLFLGANFPPDLVAGMNRGFNRSPTQWGGYYDYFLPRIGITLYKVKITREHETSAWVANAEKLIDKFNSWLNKNKDINFFAYFDFQNSHSPYPVPESHKKIFFDGSPQEAAKLGREWEIKKDKIEKEKVQEVIALYDDAIRYQDKCIGEMLNHLKKIKLYDKTLIITLADHGDSFLDHRTTHHSHSLYDEIIKIPLIIKLPGKKRPRKIKNLAALIDIVPTVLDYLGFDIAEEEFEGKSLIPLLANSDVISTPKKLKYAISLKQGNFIGIRTLKWKLVFSDESKKELFGTHEIGHQSSKELFDLEMDSSESENIYDKYKEEKEIKELEEILLKYKKRIYD